MMKQGQFCVFYSEETLEHAMFYWSLGRKQKLKLKGGTLFFSFLTCRGIDRRLQYSLLAEEEGIQASESN